MGVGIPNLPIVWFFFINLIQMIFIQRGFSIIFLSWLKLSMTENKQYVDQTSFSSTALNLHYQ